MNECMRVSKCRRERHCCFYRYDCSPLGLITIGWGIGVTDSDNELANTARRSTGRKKLKKKSTVTA